MKRIRSFSFEFFVVIVRFLWGDEAYYLGKLIGKVLGRRRGKGSGEIVRRFLK